MGYAKATSCKTCAACSTTASHNLLPSSALACVGSPMTPLAE